MTSGGGAGYMMGRASGSAVERDLGGGGMIRGKGTVTVARPGQTGTGIKTQRQAQSQTQKKREREEGPKLRVRVGADGGTHWQDDRTRRDSEAADSAGLGAAADGPDWPRLQDPSRTRHVVDSDSESPGRSESTGPDHGSPAASLSPE